MDLRLTGKVALVTGGSRGIGREIAMGFAAEGACVAVCARSGPQLDQTIDEIRSSGAKAIGIVADLFKPDDCKRVVSETLSAFGRIDALINNASTNVDKTPRSFEEASDGQLLERINGKALAAMRITRAALPSLRQAGEGRIVCIGGTSARAVFRGDEMPTNTSNLPQGLGNAAVVNFAKHLSEEVAKDGIVVNVVHPHVTRTSRHADRVVARAKQFGVDEAAAERSLEMQFPIGRMVEPSDIVPIVLLLSSPLAGAITGQSIAVDGGASRAIQY